MYVCFLNVCVRDTLSVFFCVCVLFECVSKRYSECIFLCMCACVFVCVCSFECLC